MEVYGTMSWYDIAMTSLSGNGHPMQNYNHKHNRCHKLTYQSIWKKQQHF